VERVTASGGEVGRINIAGGAGVSYFFVYIFSYQVDLLFHPPDPSAQCCIHVSGQVLILTTISLRSLFRLVHSDAGQVDCVYQGQ
jgi:hypothetical protein